jgi:hypothetical protein
VIKEEKGGGWGVESQLIYMTFSLFVGFGAGIQI